MKNIRHLPILLAAALAATFPGAARAEGETTSIKFSDSSKPGTLRLKLSNGDIRIRGTDSPDVVVATDVEPERQSPRPDGMRVISTSSSYSLLEKDNVVTLSYGAGGWPGPGGDFSIDVPRNTNVVVASSFGGDIEIGDVAGDIEVKTLNGEVKLAGVTGGVLVETMNGEIDVDVRALTPDKPLSFTSMNGEVDLTLPVDAKVNVQLRTHNGTILTDFDEKQLVTKTASLKREYGRGPQGPESELSADVRSAVRDAVRVGVEAAREATRAAREAVREANGHGNFDIEIPEPPMPPLPPMTGGKIVTGTLNGGGPELRVSTMNGTVTLRKAK